jgi:hypothetical protein
MICIGTPGSAPVHLEDTPHGIVEHILGTSSRTGVFAHGLLGEDGGDPCSTNGSDMPWGGSFLMESKITFQEE